jgi:hypothetical protein
MKLPYLRNRSINRDPSARSPKEAGAPPDDALDEHCCQELMDAAESKDVSKFRQAVEALVLNIFDWDGEEDASSSR